MNGDSRNAAFGRRVLHIIRATFLISPLAFGVFVWIYLGDRSQTQAAPGTTNALGYLFIAAAIAAVATILVIRSVRTGSTDIARAVSLTIVGWAVGEGIGILGGVMYLLTADRLPFLVGVALLFVSMMLLPVPDGVDADPEF
jgi:hypothetical protein